MISAKFQRDLPSVSAVIPENSRGCMRAVIVYKVCELTGLFMHYQNVKSPEK